MRETFFCNFSKSFKSLILIYYHELLSTSAVNENWCIGILDAQIYNSQQDYHYYTIFFSSSYIARQLLILMFLFNNRKQSQRDGSSPPLFFICRQVEIIGTKEKLLGSKMVQLVRPKLLPYNSPFDNRIFDIFQVHQQVNILCENIVVHLYWPLCFYTLPLYKLTAL